MGKNIEGWLLQNQVFTSINDVSQLYIKQSGKDLKWLIAKLTDDLLITGDTGDIKKLGQAMKKRLNIVKMTVGLEIRFIGCTTCQDEKEKWEYL